MTQRLSFVLGRVLLLVSLLPVSFNAGAQDVSAQRQAFKAALLLLEKQQNEEYQGFANGLKNYVLFPYLEFLALKARIKTATDTDIEAFMKRYEKLNLSQRIRPLWLKQLAERGDWPRFLEVYQPVDEQDNSALACFKAQALFATGKLKSAAYAAKTLWLKNTAPPPVCQEVFVLWEEKGHLTQDLLWKRIVMAMENQRLDEAKTLGKKLKNEKQQQLLQNWEAVHEDPQVLAGQNLKDDNEDNRRVLRYGIKRMAKKDVEQAWIFWDIFKEKHKFSKKEINDTEQYIVIRALIGNHARAQEWLNHIDNDERIIGEWRIRVALKNQDWPQVITSIETLPAPLKQEEQWQYWLARAINAIAKENQDPLLEKYAHENFVALAQQKTYYGFLAADQVGLKYEINLSPPQYAKDEIKILENLPGMLRARELFYVGMSVEARREWSDATQYFTEAQLKIAAQMADSWGWHDRAIFTYARTLDPHKSHADIRFPMAYKEMVMQNAQANKLDPAWIYGVVRQESAFMPDAKSPAGAVGLMQLMPGTASWVSRSIKDNYRGTADLTDPGKNIKWGSAYLRLLLEKTGNNLVLATASYNAGENRAKTWRPKTNALEADIWVDTIPYTETREYVARVLAYMVIFDQLLGGGVTPLKDRMAAVTPLVQATP